MPWKLELMRLMSSCCYFLPEVVPGLEMVYLFLMTDPCSAFALMLSPPVNPIDGKVSVVMGRSSLV